MTIVQITGAFVAFTGLVAVPTILAVLIRPRPILEPITVRTRSRRR